MRRKLAPLLVLAVLVASGASACSKQPDPKVVLGAFVELWTKAKTDGQAIQDSHGTVLDAKDVLTQLTALAGDLKPTSAKLTAADPVVTDATATSAVTVDWTVSAGVVWNYQTTVKLAKNGKAWNVVWTPQTVHPKLQAGDKLAETTLPASRGQILDGSGAPIITARQTVDVGVVPKDITNQAALIAALDAAFKSVSVDVDLSGLPAQIAAAKPDQFVEVVTLRREVYQQIRDKIHELPGTQFNEGTLQLAPTRTFARALLGSVDEVTKEQLDANPGLYAIGDQVGQSGIEKQYDLALRGTSGVRVAIAGKKNSDGTTEADQPLFGVDAKPGTPIKTMLDQKIQTAADAALAGQPLRTALVAVRISDGALVAVANGPNGGDLNLAFTASVPPGSTFKVITALGLLDKGAVTVDTPVNCPKVFTVGGRSFNNANNFELGTVPFQVDFAKSCNTAFASLAPQLNPDLLKKAGAEVGVGTAWNLGVDANTGTVPANVSDVEAAAAAFGQGQTLVSPVAMAGAAAAVARGAWIQPTIFAQLPAGAAKPTAGTTVPADGTKLNAASVTALHTMMREVVTQGTATGLQGLPGGDVFAKTGTAEYDNNPADTHAWTVGWRGNYAFAIFVEKGGSSGATAVPIIANFLKGF
jgi:cell division protein FtsI/penicillin-binding protein 2